MEETGLEVTLIGETPREYGDGDREVLVPLFINRHRINDTHEHISFMYVGTSDTRELNPAEGEKQDGFKWFTEEELGDPQYGVLPRIVAYAKAALEAARK